MNREAYVKDLLERFEGVRHLIEEGATSHGPGPRFNDALEAARLHDETTYQFLTALADAVGPAIASRAQVYRSKTGKVTRRI